MRSNAVIVKRTGKTGRIFYDFDFDPDIDYVVRFDHINDLRPHAEKINGHKLEVIPNPIITEEMVTNILKRLKKSTTTQLTINYI